MHAKPTETNHPIHEIIRNRWSPRSFAPDRIIDERSLLTLLEAARWAPSCFNDQPWRFVVCNRTTHKDTWQSLLDCLAEKNQQWAKNAPVLLLAVANNNFGHNEKPNRWSEYDTGAASLSLCLQAVAMGLVTHQMGGFDAEKCRKRFGLPEDCKPMSVIAVGYQADAELLPPEFVENELKPRQRRPADQSFFFGAWTLT
jgi:nitroreductase